MMNIDVVCKKYSYLFFLSQIVPNENLIDGNTYINWSILFVCVTNKNVVVVLWYNLAPYNGLKQLG